MYNICKIIDNRWKERINRMEGVKEIFELIFLGIFFWEFVGYGLKEWFFFNMENYLMFYLYFVYLNNEKKLCFWVK